MHIDREDSSTTTNLLQYTSHILNQLEMSSQMDALYMDFSKVFDTLNHQKRVLKLRAYGVDAGTIA